MHIIHIILAILSSQWVNRISAVKCVAQAAVGGRDNSDPRMHVSRWPLFHVWALSFLGMLQPFFTLPTPFIPSVMHTPCPRRCPQIHADPPSHCTIGLSLGKMYRLSDHFIEMYSWKYILWSWGILVSFAHCWRAKLCVLAESKTWYVTHAKTSWAEVPGRCGILTVFPKR